MIVIHTQPNGTPSPTHQVRTPTKYLNNYVIDFECPLGKGNFSTVYRSSKVSEPGSVFAVKLINIANLREQKIEHLVGAEIEILKAANHINVITCHDVFCDDTWCYIFTPFYDGGNLESHIRKTTLNETEMIPMIKDIFEGLHYLEKSKIIHRDIKAANIFIKGGRAVIADLGFAKYFKYFIYYFSEPFYDLTIGSPPFMPPEALTKGYYCNKTDVWAFGALLYEIFHGESPFAKCSEINELIQQVSTPMTVVNIRLDLSIEMKQMILSCLEIDITKRPTFSEIEQSWYFKKIFYPSSVQRLSSTVVPRPISRSPLKVIAFNPNKTFEVNNQQDHTPIKSPTFTKINQLKSEFKRKISEQSSISSQVIIEAQRTPKKSLLETSEKKYFSHKKSNTSFIDNEEDLTFDNQTVKTVSKITIVEGTKIGCKIWKYLNLAKMVRINNEELLKAKERMLKFCFSQLVNLEEIIKAGEIVFEMENQNNNSSLNHLSYEIFTGKNEAEKEMHRIEVLNSCLKDTDNLSDSTISSKNWMKRKEFNFNLLNQDLDLIEKLELQQIMCSPEHEEYQNNLRLIISDIRQENPLQLNTSNRDFNMFSSRNMNSPKSMKMNVKYLDRSKRFSIQETLPYSNEPSKKSNFENLIFKNYSVSHLRQ